MGTKSASRQTTATKRKAKAGPLIGQSAYILERRRTPSLQVDRNLTLYLPRLAVLVSIVADRPGAWFPGPLGPYQA
jgi:hypothetical protein